MTRKKKCKKCGAKHGEYRLYYAFWSLPNPNNHDCHVDKENYSFPICFGCLTTYEETTQNEQRSIIGYLTKQQKEEYVKNVTSKEYQTLQEEGLVILDEAIHQSITTLLTLNFYNLINVKKIAPLKDNIHANTTNDQYTTNDHRICSNLYSEGDSTPNIRNKMNELCAELLTYIAKKLMPHRAFALLAHRNYTSQDTNENILEGDQRSIRQKSISNLKENEIVLHLENLNLLLRGQNLKNDQTLHVDGLSMKLLLLIVDRTGENGYSFNYIPRSHNITDHQRLKDTQLPLKLTKTIRAKRGSIIVFFENLIHSGGCASEPTTDYTTRTTCPLNYKPGERLIHEQKIKNIKWFKKKEDTPTDISFQLLLRYGSITEGSMPPNQTNLWYTQATEDDTIIPTQIEKELGESNKTGQKRLKAEDQTYIKCLSRGLSLRRKLDSTVVEHNPPKRSKPQGKSPEVTSSEMLNGSPAASQPESAGSDGPSKQMDVEESKSTSPMSNDGYAVASTSEEVSTTSPPLSEKPEAMDVEEVKSSSSSSSVEGGGSSAASAHSIDDTNIDYSDLIDSALSDVLRLEDMVIPEVDPLESLTFRDLAQLEAALQIGDHYNYGEDDGWKGDWAGNLDMFRKEVVVNKNYLNIQPSAKPIRIDYCDWVASNARDKNDLRGLELLFRYVYHMKGTPAMAKKILAYALQRPAQSLEERLDFIIKAANRMNYDPVVLHEDGWTVKKSDNPEGPLGGAVYIGRRVMWQKHEAVIVGYIPDETYGGLWKGVFLEDLDTFDMEPGELQMGLKKWENKQRQKTTHSSTTTITTGSTRFAATAKFSVPGIENGIILAKPTTKASKGIMWPARVRNVIEGKLTAGGKVRRNSSKNQIHVIFLAPFWNAQAASPSKMSNVTDPYSLGPLFEHDTIEVSEFNIQEYTTDSISIEQLESSFRFLGLPKGVFARYLDSHRLAVSLKAYAVKHMPKNRDSEDQLLASASLTESHVLSVKAPIFPNVVLNLPFDYILSKLAHPSDLASASLENDEENIHEPVIDIDAIVHSLSPPDCFGQKSLQTPMNSSCLSPEALPSSPDTIFTPSKSARRALLQTDDNDEDAEAIWLINKFASDFLVSLFQIESAVDDYSVDGIDQLGKMITSLVSKLRQLCSAYEGYGIHKKILEMKKMLSRCLLLKGYGEDCLEHCTIPPGVSKATIVSEWRKACERIYKRAVGKLSFEGFGDGVTSVITDSRCNGHITPIGSFERPVRLPVAIKGAKRAGAGTDRNVLLIAEVEDNYYSLAEKVVIPKAHKKTYIERLKTKIQSIPPDQKGVPLTDDSDGEGGDDTMGSRGSYAAAVVGVGASLKAVDMVVTGKCVNVFCAVRPPGHHAGRELRPMKAVSNGFCLFNAAACAAIYATTPLSQGGLGLRRVCVIDFDVHHGNGTQDILCSTYDPRYLYVSIHAGGAHINGFEDEDSEDESFRLRLGGKKTEGIFPGRCGDSSPHKGVLNIPLGQKVTASAMGSALVSQVAPRVEEFSPDLIILSAGFDAHENDPLGMGGLSAADFGSVTEVACQMAYKTCSGRILSVLEGGYGVPCCRARNDIFLPSNSEERLLDLGDDLPSSMGDEVHYTLRQKLDKCHEQGFLECVQSHVASLVKCAARK